MPFRLIRMFFLPITTGLPMVSARNRLISAGSFHGMLPALPITRLADIATIKEIIISYSIYHQTTQEKAHLLSHVDLKIDDKKLANEAITSAPFFSEFFLPGHDEQNHIRPD